MSRGVSVPDQRVLTALRTAYENGERDAGGGSHAEHVAHHLPLAEATLKHRLRRLAEDDRIGRAHGFSANGDVRQSYLPPEEVDEDLDRYPRR